jgi:hypothetical protein
MVREGAVRYSAWVQGGVVATLLNNEIEHLAFIVDVDNVRCDNVSRHLHRLLAERHFSICAKVGTRLWPPTVSTHIYSPGGSASS